VVECPPDGIDEGEGPCYDGYEDHFNGGCGSNPVVFSELSPSNETITICGVSGNYDDNLYRETDWYLLDLTCELTTVAACVTAEFEVSLVFIDLREGCAGFYPYSFAMADACETACLTETLRSTVTTRAFPWRRRAGARSRRSTASPPVLGPMAASRR